MKKFNVTCFAQFGRYYDIDIIAKSKKEALKNLKDTIKNIGYEYCKGDEVIIDVDDCTEIEKDGEK